MNKLKNLYDLQFQFDKIGLLKKEEQKIKRDYSIIENGTKKKYYEWKQLKIKVKNLKTQLTEKELEFRSLDAQVHEPTRGHASLDHSYIWLPSISSHHVSFTPFTTVMSRSHIANVDICHTLFVRQWKSRSLISNLGIPYCFD